MQKCEFKNCINARLCLEKNMQCVYELDHGVIHQLTLPDPNDEVLPGIRWGNFEDFNTPAYWASQIWILRNDAVALSFRLGRSLKEEAAACLLGGHAIPAEMALAAYDALRDRGLLDRHTISSDEIAAVLRIPLRIADRT